MVRVTVPPLADIQNIGHQLRRTVEKSQDLYHQLTSDPVERVVYCVNPEGL